MSKTTEGDNLKRTYSALILAGGKARRMGGKNKALLQLEQQTFLSRLETALAGFDEKLISLRDTSWIEETSFSPILDQVADRGPLEGLRCALSLCRSDALLVVACDVPLFSKELAQAMLHADQGYDAMVCLDHTGHLHPLCGIYSKKCLPVIETMISEGNLRISGILDAVHSAVFSFDDYGFSDVLLTNVNHPEILESLQTPDCN